MAGWINHSQQNVIEHPQEEGQSSEGTTGQTKPWSTMTNLADWPPRTNESLCQAFARSPRSSRPAPLVDWHQRLIAREYNQRQAVTRPPARAGKSTKSIEKKLKGLMFESSDSRINKKPTRQKAWSASKKSDFCYSLLESKFAAEKQQPQEAYAQQTGSHRCVGNRGTFGG
jgi:hypothetical protein